MQVLIKICIFFRFIPDGIYLNAKVLGPQKLAKVMNNTIYRKSRYYNYFKWHHYYTFHYPEESPDSDHICQMCTIFNIIKQMQATSSYMNINSFWRNYNNKTSSDRSKSQISVSVSNVNDTQTRQKEVEPWTKTVVLKHNLLSKNKTHTITPRNKTN